MIAERPGRLSAGAVLAFEHLAVGYTHGRRTRSVLAGLSGEVGRGELVCLLGPNGAGKSTLLRTVAGLQPALGGCVTIAGEDLAALRRRDLAQVLALVLTERVEVGALTVAELVGIGRHPHTDWWGRMGPTDLIAVADALADVGAEALAGRQVNELSDGERQRVMVARALAQEPELLLLDEPTAFLDVGGRLGLFGLLRRLARDRGLGVLVATHDLDLSLRGADRLWLVGPDGLVQGPPDRLVADGSVAAVLGARVDPMERAELERYVRAVLEAGATVDAEVWAWPDPA